MANFDQFIRQMGTIAINVERNADRVVRGTALVIDRSVVLETPVDTGRARSNWIVTLNAPSQATIPPYAPGSHLGRGEGANAQAAMNQAAAAVGRFTSRDRAIYITNNLPYIEELDDGSSRQAPAGMTRRAVLQGITYANQFRVI